MGPAAGEDATATDSMSTHIAVNAAVVAWNNSTPSTIHQLSPRTATRAIIPPSPTSVPIRAGRSSTCRVKASTASRVLSHSGEAAGCGAARC